MKKADNKEFELKRAELGDIIAGIKPYLKDFKDITDSTELYTPLRNFELEHETTETQLRLLVDKAKSNPEYVEEKDGNQVWTNKGGIFMREEQMKILDQVVKFNFDPIDKAKTSSYPSQMGGAVYLLWDKLFK